MRNLFKKTLVSFALIVIGLLIEYINDAFLGDGTIMILLPIIIGVGLFLVVGLFWNDVDLDEPILLKEHEPMQQMDAKLYLKKRYIDKELTDEEYTVKMSRL